MAKEDRFRNVKQAEYEILKMMMQDERIRERLHERMAQGVVGSGQRAQIARDRANKALSNLSHVFRGMMEKRLKHLPSYHIDYGAERVKKEGVE